MNKEKNPFNNIHLANEEIFSHLEGLRESIKNQTKDSNLNISKYHFSKSIIQKLIEGNTGEFFNHDFQESSALKVSINKNNFTLQNSSSYEIDLSFKLMLELYIKFLVRFIQQSVLLLFISIKGKRITKNKPINVIYFLSLEKFLGTSYQAEFKKFLNSGQIKGLNNSFTIYENPYSENNEQDFTETKHPLIHASRFSQNRVRFFFSYVKESLKMFSFFHLQLFSTPELLLIEKELSQLPLAYTLDSLSIIDSFCISNSLMFSQPLWFHKTNKNFQTTMLWYSTNSKPLNYRNHLKSQSMFYFKYLEVDIHYVWNKSEKKWIEDVINRGDIIITKPIMLRPLPLLETMNKKTNGEITITIFDVSPYKEDVWNQSFSKKSFNYYTFPIVEKFYNDIIATCNQIKETYNIQITLQAKNKRGFPTNLDPRYKVFLKNIKDDVIQIEHSEDIFKLINSSTLTIVFPYSSPALISNEIEIPSFFYDSTGLLDPEGSHEIPTIESQENLLRAIEKLILPN
jgi:hypothetical protein